MAARQQGDILASLPDENVNKVHLVKDEPTV